MITKKKILIVDDEEKSRLYLATILVELFPHFETSMASTPTEALFMLSKQSFDCLFLDVEMPGMTGLELVSQLWQGVSQIPVIFVSAYKRADFIQSALRLNAVDYLDKPVDPFELERAVKKALFENHTLQSSPIQSTNEPLSRFRLFTDKGDRLVLPNEIAYFETEKRYSRVYFADGTSDSVRTSLSQLIPLLPSSFLHVGRQYVANIDYVKYFSKTNKTLTLIFNNERVELSKIFPNVFPRLISKFGGR